MKKPTIKQIAMVGVLAAMVFAATYFLRIPIPTPVQKTMLHMGNVMCLVSGFVLGPWLGGMSAGIGSALYDVFDPVFLPLAPFTFVFKFLMAFVCGKIAYGNNARARVFPRNIVAACAGQVTYIILHLSRVMSDNMFVKGVEWETNLITTVQSAGVSLLNAVFAVVISVPLAMAINKSLGSRVAYK